MGGRSREEEAKCSDFVQDIRKGENRVVILLRPMHVKDNDIVTLGVQNVSVVHPQCP